MLKVVGSGRVDAAVSVVVYKQSAALNESFGTLIELACRLSPDCLAHASRTSGSVASLRHASKAFRSASLAATKTISQLNNKIPCKLKATFTHSRQWVPRLPRPPARQEAPPLANIPLVQQAIHPHPPHKQMRLPADRQQLRVGNPVLQCDRKHEQVDKEMKVCRLLPPATKHLPFPPTCASPAAPA